MILTCSEMKALEERAFAEGISAEALMDEAGRQIANAVMQFVPSAGRCLVFFGKGHNGGDALVAARHLAVAGWEIELR
ncbi:MAG TPA: NAD(P)H-hydrate epimerase, partial [Chthoniobacteraceae bacterium]|nr:NAD(P)H-hydrate epimerase [Chthoniobacteraceae bacterium]